MAEKKAPAKKPAAKKAEAALAFEDGYWFVVDGTNKTNVGRSRRYAELMLDKYK